MPNYGTDALETLQDNGKVVPQTRMENARACQDFCRRLIDNDSKRSYKRARLNGLVDGNPPYSAAALAKAKRADACNVNWGTARSYMESGTGAFYDLSSEAPSVITVRTSHGQPDEKDTWSAIISKELDTAFKNDPLWDYQMQISQWEMVLHGVGPFVFEDKMQVFPRAVLCGDLKVPERAKSDTGYWEICMVQVEYYPYELFKFIENREAAEKVGWDVEYTRRVIANAMDIQSQRGIQLDWEFYQQELKNNSYSYVGNESLVCRTCHVFWQEFDGTITHAIVERGTSFTSNGSTTDDDSNADVKYLFKSMGRYQSFQGCVHPMYYDHGNGGFHHSVTGLGVKMYSAMAYENRLLCNLCDKAFSPKILFSPTTTEAQQKFSLLTMGDYAVLPANVQVNQAAIAGLLNDGLEMRGELSGIMQSTLSNYRQSVPQQKSGNPVTKFEKQMEAAIQSALSKTQFNRYYKQLDMLYAEIYKRFTNLNTTDERAKIFQERCTSQGVPRECFGRTEQVCATRVVGQGNLFTRKQAIDALFAIAGALPEEGREKLIQDKIAAEAGQGAVMRYFPAAQKQMGTDQQAFATEQVASMKVGVAPVVTSSQNAIVYATTFLKAAAESLASLSKGANPMEVYSFLQMCGPAIAAHLKRFEHDPTRAEAYKVLMEQWKQVASTTDKLKAQLQKMVQARNGQQQKTQDAMTDAQIKTAKARNDIATKTAKTKAQLEQSQQKHRLKIAQGVQDLQISDAKAASEIRINRLKAFSNDNGSES